MMASIDLSMFPNGVNGATGDYPTPLSTLIAPPAGAARARSLMERAEGTLGLPFGIEGTGLVQAGCGVVAHEAVAPFLFDALAPLIADRDGKMLICNTGETRAKRKYALNARFATNADEPELPPRGPVAQ